MSPLSSSQELAARHGRYITAVEHRCACRHCDWRWKGSQSGANAAARRHVIDNRDHEVITRREQAKVTRSQMVTVLR